MGHQAYQALRARFHPEPQGSEQVFFPGNNSFFHLPLRFAKYVQQQKPDIIIAHSFGFAFQQAVLNFFLPKKAKVHRAASWRITLQKSHQAVAAEKSLWRGGRVFVLIQGNGR